MSDEWIFQSFSSNWNEWFDSRNYREFDGSEIFSMDIKFFSDDLMQTKEREEKKNNKKSLIKIIDRGAMLQSFIYKAKQWEKKQQKPPRW